MSGAPLRPRPPRGLILLAAAWLVIAWAIHIGIRPPIQTHAASYTPGVRMMLLSVALGIMIAWPLLRLSGPPRAWPIRQALLDLTVLLCLAQVAVWPLRLVTPWPPERSAAIDVCLILWSLAVAAPVAVGTRPQRRGGALLRSACMLTAVLFVGLAPLSALLLGETPALRLVPTSPYDFDWWRQAAWSPLTALHALSGGGADAPSVLEWRVALFSAWIALPAWAIAVGLPLFFRPSPLRTEALASAGERE